jgi:hypothetical protein
MSESNGKGTSPDDPPGRGALLSISARSVTGTHEERAGGGRALVAPGISPTSLNTLRPVAHAVACWRAADVNFDFDSAFIVPRMKDAFADLKALLDAHPGCPMTLFGHADPVGNDEPNKQLSGRRSQAVFATLTRRVDLWEDLHRQGDLSAAAERTMIATLGFVPDDGDTKGKTAVQAFQRSAGLPPSGTVDGATRAKLYERYMDAVCRDSRDAPYRVEPTGFLGKGSDKGGKADFQGCGEFNPVLIFSTAEKAALEKDIPERNAENAPNRRVLALLFAPGSLANVAAWPCPRVKENTGGCRARFFTDHAKRRANGTERREFKNTRDTFACRFYHQLNVGSPCERFQVGGGLLLAQVFSGDGLNLLTGRKYRIRSADGKVQLSGELDGDGLLRHEMVPPQDYTLSVSGCSEDARLVVLRLTDTLPLMCMLANGRLAIHVRSTDDLPVPDATVTVEGVGQRLTDDDGIAYFGTVPEGTLKFTVKKEGFEPVGGGDRVTSSLIERDSAGTTEGAGSAGGSAEVKDARVDAKATLEAKTRLTGIVAEQGGAISVHDQRKTLESTTTPAVTAISATVDPASLLVFIRNSDQIKLIAQTEPAGRSVTWSLKADPSASAANTELNATVGNDVLLSTGGQGLFTVEAKSGGTSIFCNIVIASVQVDPSSPIITNEKGIQDLNAFSKTPEGKKVLDDGSLDPSKMTGVATGLFEFGKHLWSSEVRITLKGGGADGRLGLAKVQVHLLQNAAQVRVRGIYDKNRRFFNETTPVLDTSEAAPRGWKGPVVGLGVGIQTPFLFTPGMVREKSRTDTTLVLEVGDSPAEGFANRVKDELLQRIEDVIEFRTVVTSFSTDAKNSIVAHADTLWSIDFTGDVEDAKAIGKWVNDGRTRVKKVQPWQPITRVSGGPGTTVFDARVEIFPPLFADVTNKPPKGEVPNP